MDNDYSKCWWKGNLAGGIIKVFTIYKDTSDVISDYLPYDKDVTINSKESKEILDTLGKAINLDMFDINISNNIIVGVLKDSIYNDNIKKFKLELKKLVKIKEFIVRDNPFIVRNQYNGLYNLGIRLPYKMTVITQYFIIDRYKFIGEDSTEPCVKLTSFARKAIKNSLGKAIYFDEIFF